MDSRLYIHCPILGQRTAPYFVLIFIPWGGGDFLAIFHVLITYFSRPPPDAFYFLPQGAAVLFFFCFQERWRRTELEYSSTGKGQKIPNCVFHVSIAFICFFFLIKWWCIGYCPTFSSEEYVWCHMWRILVDGCAEPSKDTSSKRVVDVHLHTVKRKDGEKSGDWMSLFYRTNISPRDIVTENEMRCFLYFFAVV